MNARQPQAAATRIMGVLNVTPDSFSDGGNYMTLDSALRHARELVRQGANIIDVGGESTRPGAARVTPELEQQRVLPIIEALVAEGITVSIDTVHAATARLAVAAGASIINDVSGGTADPHMLAVAAETGATFIVMHWRGIPDPEHSRSGYADVVEDVRSELAQLADAALAAGVRPANIVVDPGLGFDKTTAQGWQLLANFDRIASLGYPVLIGVSRKRMLGETLDEHRTRAGQPATERNAEGAADASNGSELADRGGADHHIADRDGVALHIADRDMATAVVSAFSAAAGAWGVRVHDVRATVNALAVADALESAQFATSRPKPTRNGASTGELRASNRSGSGAGVGEGEGDRITLTGLEVFAHHGVFGFEREQGQRFVIDAEVTLNLRAAAAGDDLARTVNYAELAGAIHEATASDPVDLIETLAERIAGVALSFDGVHAATITVHKPDAPIDATFTDVSVTIRRSRDETTLVGDENGSPR